jgi:hypothetical protein
VNKDKVRENDTDKNKGRRKQYQQPYRKDKPKETNMKLKCNNTKNTKSHDGAGKDITERKTGKSQRRNGKP